MVFYITSNTRETDFERTIPNQYMCLSKRDRRYRLCDNWQEARYYQRIFKEHAYRVEYYKDGFLKTYREVYW